MNGGSRQVYIGGLAQQQHPQQHQQGFARPPQQPQPTPSQPIRLSNPTNYHLQEKNRRKEVASNDGAPPTPQNSFPNTHTTVDPSILGKSVPLSFHQQHPIKQEETLDMQYSDMDFVEGNTSMMSPRSNSPLSPSNNYDQDDFAVGSVPGRANAQIESASQFGESPGTHSIYSPGAENTEFAFDPTDLSTSAPSSASAVPIDMKHINSGKMHFHSPSNSFSTSLSGHPHISMSMPVMSTTTDLYGHSYETGFGSHTNSVFPDISMLGDLIPEEPDTAAKQQQLNIEKRRRRRESHNAVERRRRDNINEKIQELSTLLPDLQLDSSNKPNKGMILRKSVDYIRLLKDRVQQQDARTQELEALVRDLRVKSGDTAGSSNEPIVLPP